MINFLIDSICSMHTCYWFMISRGQGFRTLRVPYIKEDGDADLPSSMTATQAVACTRPWRTCPGTGTFFRGILCLPPNGQRWRTPGGRPCPQSGRHPSGRDGCRFGSDRVPPSDLEALKKWITLCEFAKKFSHRYVIGRTPQDPLFEAPLTK